MNTQPEDYSDSVTLAEAMPTLYLIAHKVRGQPAFDIAQRLQIGDEEGWIIPTSGHRAYPSDYFQLDWARDGNDQVIIEHLALPDADWPDHYPTRADSTRISTSAPHDLLTSLGLLKPQPPLRRL